MKLENIIKSKDVLIKLANCQTLSAVTAFRLAKNIKKINFELEEYNEQRLRLLEKYADRDENGELILLDNNGNQELQIPIIKKKEVYKEIQLLLNEDIDLSFSKIKIEDLEGAQLSPMDLIDVEFMIDDGE